LTLAEGQAKWGNHIKWNAGHIIDGQIDGILAAELSRPNQQAGARLGNQRRQGLQPTRQW
jgi:hypothetical protein